MLDCSNKRRMAGLAYPRTCKQCGLGPCAVEAAAKVAKAVPEVVPMPDHLAAALVSDECTCSKCMLPVVLSPPFACDELIVIAFTGKAGAGKSTAANHLIEKHGFVRIKFASALKEMLRTFLRYRGVTETFIEAMIEGDLKELPSSHLNGRTPRHAMQTLGTEWGRNCMDQDLWVDAERDHLPAFGRFVCDDCRFPNEANMIRDVGGSVVHVSRPAAAKLATDHESETHELPMDYMLINTGTVADLCGDLDRLVRKEV